MKFDMTVTINGKKYGILRGFWLYEIINESPKVGDVVAKYVDCWSTCSRVYNTLAEQEADKLRSQNPETRFVPGFIARWGGRKDGFGVLDLENPERPCWLSESCSLAALEEAKIMAQSMNR